MSQDNLGNEYCDLCGQILPKVKGILAIFGGAKRHKFKDGDYCEKCALIKISRARSGK